MGVFSKPAADVSRLVFLNRWFSNIFPLSLPIASALSHFSLCCHLLKWYFNSDVLIHFLSHPLIFSKNVYDCGFGHDVGIQSTRLPVLSLLPSVEL